MVMTRVRVRVRGLESGPELGFHTPSIWLANLGASSALGHNADSADPSSANSDCTMPDAAVRVSVYA